MIHIQAETLKQILNDAIYAPSGHNFQPWRFKLKEGRILIYNIPERDTTIFNYKQRGSFIALGALIENIIIAASHYGWRGENTPIDSQEEQDNFIAAITFIQETRENQLYPYIEQRVTNRKPYQDTPLQDAHKDQLFQIIDKQLGDIRLVEDQKTKDILADLFSINDILIFSNPYVHQSLFPHIRWSRAQERKNPGLFIKTLEVPAPIQIAFRLFQYRPIASLFNLIHFSRLAAKQNAKLYASSAAIGLLLSRGTNINDFVNAGILFQRFWLKSHQLGLSIQPVTALIHLGERIQEGDTKWFPSQEIQIISNAYKKIKEIFRIRNEIMALTFRIGYANPPSARSLRIPPNIEET